MPEFRSRFLELYHSRYLRPLTDYLIGSLEYTTPSIARFPCLYNFVVGARPVRYVLEHVAGMADSPLLSITDFDAVCRRWNVQVATPERLSALDKDQPARSVIIVQDAFTRYFETPMLSDWIELIARLGYQIYIVPFAPTENLYKYKASSRPLKRQRVSTSKHCTSFRCTKYRWWASTPR